MVRDHGSGVDGERGSPTDTGPGTGGERTGTTFTTQSVEVGPSIVREVGRLTGTPVEDLPQLAGVINTDALEALWDTDGIGAGGPGDGAVTFEYAGCAVTVRSDGTVAVERTAPWSGD